MGYSQPMHIARPRRLWYEAMGVDGVWSFDQNEKLTMYGFKILAAIDGFSRYPIHFQVL